MATKPAKKPAGKAGILLLVAGVLMLVTGILLLVYTASSLIPVMLGGSILVNTAAVTLLLQARAERGAKQHGNTKGGKL